MIKVESLIDLLKKNRSDFFSGVPDSVLKELSSSLKNNNKHIIATNEGSAVSIGIGQYLSSKKIPVIYMQNSGLSNALNPLISIAHKKVYSIPLILIIGWRGSPLVKDEPQHNVKGKITKNLLQLLGIKYTILRSESDLKKFDKQIKFARKNKCFIPLVSVPSTYSKVYEKDLIKNGFKLVIYANQLLRAAYPAMQNTAKTILKNSRAFEADKKIIPINEIIRLIKND